MTTTADEEHHEIRSPCHPTAARRRWTRWRPRELDVLVVGGGVVGAGSALDAATRGLSVGLVEARDCASRHLEPVQQADPRRPALPGDARLRAGRARRCRSAGCCSSGSRRTWSGRCRSSTRCSTGAGSGSTPAPGVALYDTHGAASRARARACPHHRHLTRRGALRVVPVAAQGRAGRRAAVLRRPGRRRPAHHVPRPHRGGVRRARRQPGPGRRASCARASGSSAPWCTTWSRGREHRGPGPAGDQRHRRVDRRHPGAGRRARPVPRPRVARASTSSCRATGSTSDDRADPAHREVACCSSSRGAGTGSSAPPTPTGTLDKAHPARQPQRHRLPARARQRGAARRR